MAIKQKYFGERPVIVVCTLNNLSNILDQLGDSQYAKHLYECALAVKIKHFGDNHVDRVAAALHNIGNALQSLGNQEKAKDLYKHSSDWPSRKIILDVTLYKLPGL